MSLLDFKNPVEKDMKYTRENRDPSHCKGIMKSVIYLFVLKDQFKKYNLAYIVTCRATRRKKT